MTTGLTVSITDELVAALESECRLGADQHGGMGNDYDSSLFDRIGDTLRALLAERAELKRDAMRYRFWRYMATHEPAKMARTLAYYETTEQLDTAIDAAMQSEVKP